jgi:hypothetical protein
MGKRLSIHWLLVGGILCLALGVEGLLGFGKAARRARQSEFLEERIREADRIVEDRSALEAYRSITPTLPEIELRILQREWRVAIDLLHQVQLAKFNRRLERDVPDLYRRLEDHLASMKDRCGVVLTGGDPPRNEVAWRVYNLEGAVRLLGAFVVLETENNWKKVGAALAAAIAAFKSAIEAVDEASVSSLERNIPRWNLELLHADIYVKKLSVAQPDRDRLDLRDNLEAVIPEKGGYAPGEPLERRIRK